MKKTHEIPVLFEDDYMIAVNKPPRMMSLPAENAPLDTTVLGKVQQMYMDKGVKPYLLHRLDYPTSGVLLFGKFPRDREKLESVFQHPDTQKVYHALVKGVPRNGVVKEKLQARTSVVMIPAETSFKTLHIYRLFDVSCALVEATIKTGRKHQIRQHFAHMGCPILMDATYGDFKFNRRFRTNFRLGSLFLHSKRMDFVHPITGEKMSIEAPYTPELTMVFKRLQ